MPGSTRPRVYEDDLHNHNDTCRPCLSHLCFSAMELTWSYWDVWSVARRAEDARSIATGCLCLFEWYERKYGRYHRTSRCAGKSGTTWKELLPILTSIQLAQKAIKDRLTRILVILGACAGLCYNALWYFPALIVIGGTITVLWDTWLAQKVGKAKAKWESKRRRARNEVGDAEETNAAEDIQPAQELPVRRPEAVKRRAQAGSSTDRIVPEVKESELGRAHSQRSARADTTSPPAPVADVKTHNISVKVGVSLIVGFLASFLVVMIIRGTVENRGLVFDLFSNMYLAGTIIFGGGPVVIPLLRSYVVDPGWVSPRDFLLGLAIIQAFPGPNFNFSVYLGALALASTGTPTVLGGMLSFLGIFFPGLILTVSVQSIWQAMRAKPWVLSLLRGINATAVGLVFTAVYRLWEIGYLTPESSDGTSLAREPWWVVVATLTYAETAWFGVPPAVAIVFGAVLGLGWYGAVGQ